MVRTGHPTGPATGVCLVAAALIMAASAVAKAQDALTDSVAGAVIGEVTPVSERGQWRAVELAGGEAVSALLFEADLDIDDVAEGDGFLTSAHPVASDRLVLRRSDDSYRELDLRLGSFLDVTEVMVEIDGVRAYAFDGGDDRLAWVSEGRTINIREGFWHRNKLEGREHERPVTALGLSIDGRALIFGDITGQATIMDVGDGRREAVGQGFDAAVSAAAITDDLTLIALSDGHRLQLYEIGDLNKPFAETFLEERIRDLDIVADAPRGHSIMIAASTDGAALYRIDQRRPTLEPVILAGCASPRRVWRHERIAAAHCGDGRVALFDLTSAALQPIAALPDAVDDLLLAYPSSRSDMVFLLRRNGRFSIVDRRSGVRMLRGLMSREGWIAVDRQGRFDSKGIDPKVLSWSLKSGVEGWSDIRFEQLSRAFRYPGLLGAIFAGKAGQLPVPSFDPDKDGLPLPLRITSLEFLKKHDRLDQPFQIIATAADISGHPIRDVHIYHNGRLLEPSGRFIDRTEEKVVDERQTIRVRSVAYQVPPVPGRNLFEAIGEGIGDISSPKPDDLQATLIADVVGDYGAGRLHFLGIGVGQFAQPGLTLDFPAASVEGVVDQLNRSRAASLANGEQILLLDHQVRRQSVEQAFARLRDASQPEDTVVVYLSGHGVRRGDRWLFPFSNAASLQSLGPDQALDHHRLEALLAPIRAHNILLLIDACHAGAASGALDVLEMRRHTGQLSERAGIAMIAASRATQEAIEARALGHGLFSAVIIEGLAGEADLGGDGTVSVFELADYAEEKVALYSRTFMPEPQTPESRRGAYDFALTELPATVEAIDAAAQRP